MSFKTTMDTNSGNVVNVITERNQRLMFLNMLREGMWKYKLVAICVHKCMEADSS